MRKFILGFVLGALLFSGVQVFANNVTLVGKKVGSEAELYLDGKRMSDVIIVDNKSFAPVREIAESLGRAVEYQKPEGGKAVINLNLYPNLNNLKYKASTLESEISVLKKNGIRLKESRLMHLQYNNPNASDEELESLLMQDEAYVKDFTDRAAGIEEIEKELQQLYAEIEALESAE